MKMVPVSAVMLVACASILAGCAASPGGDVEATSRSAAAVSVADAAEPTITFAANWTQTVSGSLVAGQPIEIIYNAARLASQCGGGASAPGANGGGGFAWAISGYYMMGSAAPVEFSNGTGNGVITPPVAGDLQVWFTCGSTTGNGGVDSDYGQNYHFAVAAQAAVDAGSRTDAAAATGTVVIQVVGDAVKGNAGTLPPDTIASTPISGVLVYDGPWQGNDILGQTNASGDLTATLSLGAHQIGVMMMTTDDSMFSSNGNAVTVTRTPGTLVIHVIPNTVEIETSYNAGFGNAIYVTGETTALGNWQTAYKTSYSLGNWTYQASNIPAGAQYKLILAPWVAGSTIPVTSAGVQWESGSNQTVPAAPYSVVNLTPSF
jgi:hypothetical protein